MLSEENKRKIESKNPNELEKYIISTGPNEEKKNYARMIYGRKVEEKRFLFTKIEGKKNRIWNLISIIIAAIISAVIQKLLNK